MELPDFRSGEQYWPIYTLTHAIELSLKAFAYHSSAKAKNATGKQPTQHDLRGWYDLGVQCGLKGEPEIARNIDILNELHRTIMRDIRRVRRNTYRTPQSSPILR